MSSPNSPWQRVKELFHDGLRRPQESWPSFFDEIRAESEALAAEVRALLEAHAEASLATREEGNAVPPGRTPTSTTDGPGAVIDHFKILQVLGEGGFGTVYMAEQVEPVHRRVAFKILKAGMDTNQVIARFEAERQALALMNHPNIARVYDAGSTVTGRPYFAMELVRGLPITEHCDRATLDLRARLELFVRVCSAIQHAHFKGIIHRDIKPSNVLVALSDGEAVPKVIDFGIAKALDRRLTERTLFTDLHQMLGTPDYMAPEQADRGGVDVDTRADVYSLGVLLYELLTGERPLVFRETLEQGGFAAVLEQLREAEPPRPSARVASLPAVRAAEVAQRRGCDLRRLRTQLQGDLDWIVLKALAKDRSRRYETVLALAQDIERHLADAPVLAGPETLAYRAAKSFRRHRTAILASGAIIAILVIALTVSLVLYREAVDSGARAQENAHAADLSRERAVQAERDALAALDAERAARREATGNRLSAQAMTLAQEDPSIALQLAIEGARMAGGDEANNALYAALESHRLLSTLDGHDARSELVAVSRDGRLALSADDSLLVLVWDLGTRTIRWRMDVHEDEVVALGFGPDGDVAYTASRDGTIRLWNLRTGEPGGVLTHPHALVAAQLDPSGERLAALDAAGQLHLWNLATNRPERPPLELGVQPRAQDFSADGRRFALLDRSSVLHLVDLETGLATGRAELSRVDPPTFYNVEQWYHPEVEFTPDGRRVLVRARSGQVTLHDADDGATLRVLVGEGEFSGPVRISPDGRLVYLNRREVDVEPAWGELRSLEDGGLLRRLEGANVGLRAEGAFSPDGRTLLTLDQPRGILWDVGTGLASGVLRGDPHELCGPCFLPDGERILTGSNAGELYLWARSAFPERRGLIEPSETSRRPAVIAISPTGEHAFRLVQGPDGAAGPLLLLDTASGRPVATILEQATESDHVRISDDGLRFALCDRARGQVLVLETATQRVLQTFRCGKAVHPRFDPSGRFLVVRQDGQNLVFDVAEGREVGRTPGQSAQGACLSPNGKLLANIDGPAATVTVWDLERGVRLGVVEHLAFTFEALFTPDGRYLLTFANDTAVRVLDATSLGEVARLKVPTGDYGFLRIDPRGTKVLVNTLDELLLFEIPSGRRLARWRAAKRFSEVCFHPSEPTLVVSSGSAPLRLVPLDPLAYAEKRSFEPMNAQLLERFGLGDPESRAERLREERERIVSARRWSALALDATRTNELEMAFEALARAASTRRRLPPRYHFAHACALALRSTRRDGSEDGLRRREADRDAAVEALRELVAAGYDDPRLLEATAPLASLRDHEGFRTLVASLR